MNVVIAAKTRGIAEFSSWSCNYAGITTLADCSAGGEHRADRRERLRVCARRQAWRRRWWRRDGQSGRGSHFRHGERGGLFGSLTSRAEAHVLRLSCIYSLLDQSGEVRGCHLEAALALWTYCEDSAKFIFGAALGNQVADEIRTALENAPDGLTRNDLRRISSGHRSSKEIGDVLRILVERGLVEFEKEKNSRRPAERCFSTSEGARKARKARKGEGE